MLPKEIAFEFIGCYFRSSALDTQIRAEESHTQNVLEVDSLALEEQPFSHSWTESHIRDIASNTRSIAQEISSCRAGKSQVRMKLR